MPGGPISPDRIGVRALAWLRVALEAYEIEDAELFGLHSLGGGAARHMVAPGGGPRPYSGPVGAVALHFVRIWTWST